MLTNADITIYNCKENKTEHRNEWHRTVICDVHFYKDNKVSVGDKGLNSANVYKIRIPEDAEFHGKIYVDEDMYVAAADVSNLWTLQDGDYIVYGVCETEINTPADLQELHKENCKIISWSDNRFGGNPHWRVGGV